MGEKINLQGKIQETVHQFGFQINNEEIDLCGYPNDLVTKFLYSLVETDLFVFHGTNSEKRYDMLEARQANDDAKESGNKKAVYADAGITIPLASALFNTAYIKSKGESFVTSWGDDNGKMIFAFSTNIYKLFESHDPNLFSDGYIYVLNKENFANAPDAGAEWHAESDQKPLIAIKVSKNLANDIFILGQGDKDTVREYLE